MRRRMLAVGALAAAVLSSAAGSAGAVTWQTIPSGSSDQTIELDRDSLTRDGPNIIAVVRMRPGRNGQNSANYEELVTLRIGCGERSAKVLHRESAAGGRVLSTQGAQAAGAIGAGTPLEQVAAVACFAPPVAELKNRPWLAYDWVFLAKGSDGSIWEAEGSSYKHEGNQTTVLLRARPGPDAVPPSADNGYHVRRRFYCAENAFQNLHTEVIQDHKLIGRSEVEEKRTVNPGTIAEKLFKAACPSAPGASTAPHPAPAATAPATGRALDLSAPGAWVQFGRDQNGSVFEYDQNSISRQGGQATVTIRARFGPKAPPQLTGNGAEGYQAERRISCGDNSYQDLRGEYVTHGRVTRTDDSARKEPVKPGTIADTLQRKFCGSPPAAAAAQGRAVDLASAVVGRWFIANDQRCVAPPSGDYRIYEFRADGSLTRETREKVSGKWSLQNGVFHADIYRGETPVPMMTGRIHVVGPRILTVGEDYPVVLCKL